jgi:hypothetical protein
MNIMVCRFRYFITDLLAALASSENYIIYHTHYLCLYKRQTVIRGLPDSHTEVLAICWELCEKKEQE